MSTNESSVIRESSPGKLLLQGRLQAGLTHEQVAKELYITLAKVKAIELDDYGHLNADTFVRGYIRAYANLLKLDVATVLLAYEQQLAERKRNTVPEVVAPVSKTSPKGAWPFLAVIATLFFGIWLISVWFFDNRVEGDYAVPTSNFSSLPANVDNLPVANTASHHSAASTSIPQQALPQTFENNKALVAASAVSTPANSLSSASSVNTASAVQAQVTTSNVEQLSMNGQHAKTEEDTKKLGLDKISFTFRAESWLEVSDSRGDVLATELQSVGSKISLEGKAPFDVKLGNAPAVSIELNGKKIDVIPLLGSNVLTLKVGN